MVTVEVVKVFDRTDGIDKGPLEGVQFSLGDEIEVTDAKGHCLFKNIKPGVYDVRLFKDGFGCHTYHPKEIRDTGYVQNLGDYFMRKNPYLKLSADKTKIKKNETVTIVAQLFKQDYNVTNLKQVSFSINDTQKVISDFDTDKEVAVMTLKGSNQGKVKITAQAQYTSPPFSTCMAYSNVLFLHDGVEE